MKSDKELAYEIKEYGFVKYETLARAFEKKFGEQHNMPKEHSDKMAEFVLNFFGYNDRIIDNVLESKDRDVFYMLEDYGIVDTEKEENSRFDGQTWLKGKGKNPLKKEGWRDWRSNYWLMRHDRISEILLYEEKKELCEETSIYNELSEDCWDRGTTLNSLVTG